MFFAGNSKHLRDVFQLLDYGANQAHIHVLIVPPSVTTITYLPIAEDDSQANDEAETNEDGNACLCRTPNNK